MWSLRVLLLAAGASCVSTRSLRAASVPIYEDTPAPGDSSSVYPICTEYNTLAFSQAILKESNECAIKTSYNWQSTLLPTASERRELCVCKSLMDKLQTVKVPRCSLYRSGSLVSYAQVAEYAFGLCPYGSSSGSKTSTTPTSAPVRSDTDASETGSGEGDEKKEKSKVAMIAGIAGGVVAVIIIAVIAFRCGKSRKTEKAEDVATTPTPTPPVRKRVETRRDVVDAMPLSPLEIETATHYTGVVASPAVRETKSNNRKSTTGTNSTKRTTISTGSGATTGSGNGSRGARHMRPSEHGLWEDTAILAVRIPHDAIFFGPLLSRGGYGEVYKGTYKGETVAIKQLLPGRRKDMNQIDLFMAEVKLMSSLEHERIVRFIGVAWNSLSDVCVVVEYMENGDLRSVLARWDGDEERRPNGFDADKAKIALHIAHALTYLHSLQPVVVHRDLKSKNILLDNNLDAKLTDFGVSRERADSTMTAGVGSSLWMAPEVMLGERYDEKADVFSFGVVLSELDTHKLPYSHAKESGTNQKVPDAAILQMVSLGRLSIEFTECADEAFVQLGRECVALDPKQRPTSAQVLHRVHQLYRQYL